MNQVRTYIRFPIALIIIFLILSIFSFVKPPIISSEIVKSLGLPALILSIITSVRLIFEHALRIFENNFKQHHSENKRVEEWKDYVNNIAEDELYGDVKYGETLADYEVKFQVFDRLLPKLLKCVRIAGYLEIIAIAYFLLSVILRNSFISINEDGVLLLSLTIMLLSTYFSILLADYIYKSFEKKAEKEHAKQNVIDKSQEDGQTR